MPLPPRYTLGKSGLVAGILLALLLLVVACSSTATPAPTPTALPLGGPEFSATIITTDLAVGDNQRLAFGLLDRDGFPVRSEAAQVRAIYLPPGESAGEVRDTAEARFVRWPIGPQGVFVTTLDLGTVGIWGLEATTTTADGAPVVARGAFQVAEKSATPGLGDPAPRSVTPTVNDAPDLSTITSANPPDPDLYRLSVDAALDTGKPLVVVFSTPAFCVSATCGPQVEAISEVKERHRDQANFIHVEVFENPHLLTGSRVEGTFVPAVEEWGLPSEPWTFVVDQEGKVRAKFEQFTTAEEIEAALMELF